MELRPRDETDLDALSDDLASAASTALQPEHVSLWLRPNTPAEGEQSD